MLPSMYSPMESEVFPPDVCYPGEKSPSPTTWGKVTSDSQDTENDSDVENAEDALKTSAINEYSLDSLEGAVGGSLPDLCNTGTRTISSLSLNDERGDQCAAQLPNFETRDTKLSYETESSYNTEDSLFIEGSSSQVADTSSPVLQKCETSSDLSLRLCESDFVLKKIEENLNHKNINLLPCDTGHLESEPESLLEPSTLSGVRSETPVSACDTGALEKQKQEQSISFEKLGLDLVRKNLVHSSHPSYHEWKCSAVIPSYLLSPMSLHSHGTSLGYEFAPSIIMGGSPARGLSCERDTSSEDEQIKRAKRFGLIRHLPCGVFDGSTKTRECVICMIDFSVGDRVRYLPCMHTYHTDCIDDWLMRSFTCPSCLEPVDAALLSTYETT